MELTTSRIEATLRELAKIFHANLVQSKTRSIEGGGKMSQVFKGQKEVHNQFLLNTSRSVTKTSRRDAMVCM